MLRGKCRVVKSDRAGALQCRRGLWNSGEVLHAPKGLHSLSVGCPLRRKGGDEYFSGAFDAE